jgi:hypothetical protein
LRHPTPLDCDAGEEEWILAIRYAEAPTRGVQPLRPNPDCSTGGGGCSCGGSKGKCGCGGACGGIRCQCGTRTSLKPRGAPVQCEPTSICEGFAFEVYRKPPDKPADPAGNDNPKAPVLNADSELRKRFECCVALLITQVPSLPGSLHVPATEAEAQAWYQWINRMRALLQRYFASHGSYNCKLLDQFNTIPWPTAGTLAIAALIFYAAVLLLIVWIDTVMACFCSALLPPCPPPSSEVRVPLASIHVAGKPCRVERICNWSIHRKFATTFPSLQYWLAILPFGVQLRQLLERVCCFEIGAILPRREVALPGVDAAGRLHTFAASRGGVPAGVATDAGGAAGSAAGTGGAGGAGGGADGRQGNGDLERANAAYQQVNALLNPVPDQPWQVSGASELVVAALARTKETLEFGTVIESLLLPVNQRSPDKQYLSAAETANLPQFLLANQLLRPVAGEAFGPVLGMLSKFPGLAGLGAAPSAAPSVPAALVPGVAPSAAPDVARGAALSDEMAAMKAELADLQASVKAHAAEIERLRPGHGPAPKRSRRKPG